MMKLAFKLKTKFSTMLDKFNPPATRVMAGNGCVWSGNAQSPLRDRVEKTLMESRFYLQSSIVGENRA
jgi:hypothetical protein